MKLVIPAIIIASLAGCAAITDKTGVTEPQQLCVLLAVAERNKDAEAKRDILADLAAIGYACFVAQPVVPGEPTQLLALPE